MFKSLNAMINQRLRKGGPGSGRYPKGSKENNVEPEFKSGAIYGPENDKYHERVMEEYKGSKMAEDTKYSHIPGYPDANPHQQSVARDLDFQGHKVTGFEPDGKDGEPGYIKVTVGEDNLKVITPWSISNYEKHPEWDSKGTLGEKDFVPSVGVIVRRDDNNPYDRVSHGISAYSVKEAIADWKSNDQRQVDW